MPIERVVFEPTSIPEGARRIGEEVSERVGYRKASYVRVLVVRPKYAVDEADGTTAAHRLKEADAGQVEMLTLEDVRARLARRRA